MRRLTESRHSSQRRPRARIGAEDDLRLPGRYLAASSADFLTELQLPVD